LKHARGETQRNRVNALVYVGDAMEEAIDPLCALAGELSVLGVKAFMFHEGHDAAAEKAFREIARLTGWRLCAVRQRGCPASWRRCCVRRRPMRPAEGPRWRISPGARVEVRANCWARWAEHGVHHCRAGGPYCSLVAGERLFERQPRFAGDHSAPGRAGSPRSARPRFSCFEGVSTWRSRLAGSALALGR
jgi:hypothetical protein